MVSFRSLSFIALLGSLAVTTKPGASANKNIAALKCAGLSRPEKSSLLYAEDFESSNPFATADGLETGPEYALTFVDSPVFQGKKAARFELRKTDALVKDGKRAEAVIVPAVENKDRWYAFAVYFPANDYPYDSQQEVISQWRQRPDYHLGETAGSPATALRVKKDRFLLDVGFTARQVAAEVDDKSRKKIDLGPVTKNAWHQFVFHFIHSYQEDGLIEVWHNGEKVLTHKGGNIYNNQVFPKWKIGLYKASFKNGTSEVDKRVLYFDNIRVGNEHATFEQMSPATEFTKGGN
ncbi:polysaccharide lyase [Adhaeribacter sp. BT258]|uniref:Polysaccharide lyase n=1 Tax=Adhaeribacter terrigena TaxID=2793070 RepID=A0ABS1BXS6_9BACT|nr:polysaccharide lyase [Adhaeribacter terrigena]MBK0401912.1 polysaccharide lyase [Adhaeribacter terrigena]